MVVLVVVGVAVISGIVLLRPDSRSPFTSATAGPASLRVPSSTARSPLANAVSYGGGPFDADIVRSPTAASGQAKLWYAHGAWWGVLHEPETNEARIHRLEADGSRWVDTGTLVDERPDARADVLAVGDMVYVASGGARPRPADAVRLVRFTFRNGLYRLDADFPVLLTETGVQPVALARDAGERLWITYPLDQRVLVRASDGDDRRWGPAFGPNVENPVVAPGDGAALVRVDGSVGLMWTNPETNVSRFSVHRDGEPVEVWSPGEVVSRGGKRPDDHVRPKADAAGHVYAALATAADTLPNPNSLAPKILLTVRDLQGRWREVVVARVRDGHTQPFVLLDEARRDVYVVATLPRSGAVYYKRSSMDALSFETGRGQVLIGGGEDSRIGNPTSTGDALTSDSGMVVLASDDTTGRYVYGVLRPRERGSASPPPSPPAEQLHVVVNDTFETWRDGDPLPGTWVGRGVAQGGATIRRRGDGGAVARLVAVDDGRPPRLCRGFVPITSGSARITFRVRVSAGGRSEPVLGLVRGAGGDAAEIRFGSDGTFRYFDGDRRVSSEARWRPETWYGVTLDLDVRGRTATLAIADDAGTDLLRRSGVAFPGQATSVDEICVHPAAGNRQSIEFDELIVARSVGAD